MRTEHPVKFSALSAMSRTLGDAFTKSVFFVDPGGYLEIDDEEFARHAVEMNPGVAWWND